MQHDPHVPSNDQSSPPPTDQPRETVDPPCPNCVEATRNNYSYCPLCGRPARDAKDGVNAPEQAATTPSPTLGASPAEAEDMAEPLQPIDDEATDPSDCYTPSASGLATPVSAQTTSPHDRCNRCGRALRLDDQFCSGCATPVAQPEASQIQLVCEEPGQPPITVPLSDQALRIGKSKECDLVLTSDAYVSRQHAEIRLIDGNYEVRDLESSNGTFVRVRGSRALDIGDEVIIGTTVLRLAHSTAPARDLKP